MFFVRVNVRVLMSVISIVISCKIFGKTTTYRLIRKLLRSHMFTLTLEINNGIFRNALNQVPFSTATASKHLIFVTLYTSFPFSELKKKIESFNSPLC